jgi:hypothetical protein
MEMAITYDNRAPETARMHQEREAERRARNVSVAWTVFAIIVVLLLAFGAYALYDNNDYATAPMNSSSTSTTTPMATPATPERTDTPQTTPATPNTDNTQY